MEPNREFEIRLVNAFQRPFENAVATARTCYSAQGIVSEAQVSGDDLQDESKRKARAERRDALARSIYKAGHHTTLQHAHFQFAIQGVSRHFLWSFLHSHPFYNSEQVSQRYVEVRPNQIYIPALAEPARSVFVAAAAAQMRAYEELISLLDAPVQEAYFARFPGRRPRLDTYRGEIRKKSQEIARYVLPVATRTYLYHTISGITLLRYARLMNYFEVSAETRSVVSTMLGLVLQHDPLYRTILEEPLDITATPEFTAFAEFAERRRPSRFIAEWDRDMNGRFSRLVDSLPRNETLVANAVREVLGLLPDDLNDDDAIRLVLHPAQNKLLAQSLNLSTHSRLTRALYQAHYVFKKRLSHTADSQEQRHRMTPASRPLLLTHFSGEPDVVVPGIVDSHPAIRRRFDDVMDETYSAIRQLIALGASMEDALYLLPNAVRIRYSESADLLNLRHRLTMRLCFNAQEEIWRASLDEFLDLRAVNPRIAAWLGAPCDHHYRADVRPTCPEGARFCGVPVWKQDAATWDRVI